MDHKQNGATTAERPAPKVTIKDLAAELGLSITTISRALGGYPDVGDKTRQLVVDAAARLGYLPSRTAQRLVTQRTHNIAWVQPDDELKFLDPHFLEVLGGALRGARAAKYDLVITSHTLEHELSVYDRYVKDRSVDAFIVDLPRENDPRIDYLLRMERPFVVHGREERFARYGWVDMDHYGSFYRLARLLIDNGHRRIAFINGDERFHYALHRRRGVSDAVADAGLPDKTLAVYNAAHPLGSAGYQLTLDALDDPEVTAVIYSSILTAIEGLAAVERHFGEPRNDVAIAAMDDELHYVDLSHVADRMTFVRASLRDAGVLLVEEIARQCDRHAAPRGSTLPTRFDVHASLDASGIDTPLPAHRQGFLGRG